MQKSPGRKQTAAANSQSSLKSIGLFDHIKHIQFVRDPNYYNNLSESDRKTFNLFMILRGLSMNPAFIEYAGYLYRYLDIIPPAQYYKILIELYPRHGYKEFHKWIKSNRDKDETKVANWKKLTELVMQKYDVSKKEANDYIRVFQSSKQGKEELFDVCRGFGLTDKEVEALI